ncbi:MAG: SUF system NifU family Fe-S cluster assembly protein [Acidobacteria bacterium]|nr:SUF system NifU family Fe-S cluster assembly protein [Acidobacteriota bacterium]
MTVLTDLYQEVILDHNRAPRNFGPLDHPDRTANGHNPLCGDELRVYVALDGNTVTAIQFEGSGCAISKASASLMTEAVKGKSTAEVDTMFRAFHDLMTGDPSVREAAGPQLGKLAVFEGVREFPIRVKCATLAWHTLEAALHEDAKVASTE